VRGAFDGRWAGDERVCCALGVSQARQERVVWQAGDAVESRGAAGAERSGDSTAALCAAEGRVIVVWGC
jgi:hypothetical protein